MVCFFQQRDRQDADTGLYREGKGHPPKTTLVCLPSMAGVPFSSRSFDALARKILKPFGEIADLFKFCFGTVFFSGCGDDAHVFHPHITDHVLIGSDRAGIRIR